MTRIGDGSVLAVEAGGFVAAILAEDSAAKQ
jgi:hypothetical protein